MRTLTALLIAAMMAFSVPALAQNRDDQQLQERTYDFGDDIVEGELVRPDGELIEGQIHGGGSSLITIRDHFIDKMIESVEDL